MTIRLLSILFTMLLVTSLVGATGDDEPWYVPGGHYGASFEQGSGRWRLLPLDGEDVEVGAVANCGREAPIPPGLWLLVQDGPDRAVLVAPSTTPLPPGHEGVVALRACGDPANGVAAVRAPRSLIEWLLQTTGAIHVGN
jgi:hypothetical protein